MNKIYLLERVEEYDYDEYDSVVVIAKDHKQAEEIALKWHWWIDDERPQITFTVTDLWNSKDGDKARWVLGSFNAW